ncbi:DUF2933 domain-containing protein [Rhizobium bangladeshense]|uniref:DUF2933 domain-containing protein n=1 Tax=Rhizobium bangladeshense TaxID=1138189 RepID=UPI001A99BB6B|nr:DUF2933 domain-containing protein [Rhizobium bangladeshense]MBX4894642.1 DUF2933 domain-containing protein [Rhizobium bangladeshense]MBX4903472.1 DUF2933 domain-containing protein [Rhizobium bangladeshense]MBX4914836.1 DUF2933 domain-containing protein [Rhizobium bangladeshense]MBY3597832.1 DUF2933 domain-containing protein [Rhizobium bangladeshense]MBY3612501.1 DUF2933 domain-containing protein [Rhizobium bangladeshense]
MSDNHSSSAWSTYSRIVFIAFAAIALGLIAYEHRVHLLGILPWFLILACPLMHLFMHHGHHGHGGYPGHDHARHRAGTVRPNKETGDV